jgi:hypothetical protein
VVFDNPIIIYIELESVLRRILDLRDNSYEETVDNYIITQFILFSKYYFHLYGDCRLGMDL